MRVKVSSIFRAALPLLLAPLALLVPAKPASSSPPPIVILYDGLTAADLHSPDLPALRALADRGARSLMNTAMKGPRTHVSAVATLACGSLVAISQRNARALLDRELPNRPGNAQRTGTAEEPAAHFAHQSVASPIASDAARCAIGPLLAASRTGAPIICGNDDGTEPSRPAVLFGMSGGGAAMAGPIRGSIDEMARAALASPTGAVIDLGWAARSGNHAALERLLERVSAGGPHNVLVIAPRTEMQDGVPPRRLALVVAAGPSFARGLLTSPTTRTVGLIANVDVAPWMLRQAEVPAPSSFTGHPFTVVRTPNPTAALDRLDRITTRNAGAFLPTLMILGAITALAIFGGLALRKTGWAIARFCAYALVCMMTMPLAMLVTPAIEPLTPNSCGWWMVTVIVSAVMVAIAAVALLAARARVQRTPEAGRTLAEAAVRRAAVWVSAVSVVVAIVDAATGQRLTRFALISSYQMEGIRYYGTGNEYMGLIVGMALLAAFMWPMRTSWAIGWLGVVSVVLGLPSMGANAGGMVAAVCASWCGVVIIRGKRVSWKQFVLGSAAGFAAAFAFAWLDQRMSGAGATHMGLALSSAQGHGVMSLATIILRKIGMNAALLMRQYTLMALVGVGGAVWLARGMLAEPIQRAARRSPDWWRGGPAFLCGSLAAFLYNDSGIVAALFLSGIFLATGFALLFALPLREDARAEPTAETTA